MDLPTVLRRLAPRGGAPLALPRPVDAVAERWWRLTPRTRAAVVAVLVVAALALVGRGATTSPWGPPREVVVTAVDLPAGHALTAADLHVTDRPAALVPSDALGSAATTAGDRVRGPVPAGTVLTSRHLVDGVAAMVAPGRVAVPVPIDGLPRVTAGDVVHVVAATPEGSGVRVATGARVLAVEADHLWLDVADDRADQVAGAGAAGRITLAVRPSDPASG